MKTRIFSILALLFGLLPCMSLTAYAASVSYVDGNGTSQTVDATELESTTTSWTDGSWYIVPEGGLTISGRIAVSGTVNLILRDGAELKASEGITTTGATLNIYAQSTGTGALTATGNNGNDAQLGGGSAGIGGNGVARTASGGAGGTVNIYGGTVTATGGNGTQQGGGGAGIGGGGLGYMSSGGQGGTVNIYGGTVTATGGKGPQLGGGGAGIGGGGNGSYSKEGSGAGGTVKIYGGTVTATGGTGGNLGGGGAGIGGGGNGSYSKEGSGAGGTVNICGGTVTATGGTGGNSGGVGAGIGGGGNGYQSSAGAGGTLTLGVGAKLYNGTDNTGEVLDDNDSERRNYSGSRPKNMYAEVTVAAITANEGATGEYWATYYNGTTSFTADANTTVYQAAVNSGKTAVVLTEVTGREIPAGKGVVLKSSAATIKLTPTTTTQTLEGNELKGVDVATTAPSNAYCLSKETTGSARGVGFYTYEGTIPAHRAYLVVAGGPSLTRGFLGFGDDDNTTGISLPEAVVIENDGPIYDLSGRRIIGQPQKGIYVKNGKKVVIK